MTRILYWNINNFSLNKIADPNNLVNAQSRRDHIVDEVFRGLSAGGVVQLPDIFVIVEVYARLREVGIEGTPVVGNARAGVLQLLVRIRAQTGNPNWQVVPPVWSGDFGFGEGIAVYYNQATVQFTGPYVYGPDYRTASISRANTWRSPPINRACPMGMTLPQAGQPVAAPPVGWLQNPQTYGASWIGALGTRVTPGGVLPNENMLAGQYDFYLAGNRIYFPYSMQRSPFYTRFLEVGGAGRTIKLFSLHTSPGFATRAVQQLALVPDLVPGAGEVTVVAGDFNVDTFDSRQAYDGLVGTAAGGPGGLQMQMAFRSETGGAIQLQRRPYCLTHYLPTASATSDGLAGGVTPSPVHDVYPRYGYMGSMGGFLFRTPVNSGAIDNILTRYGAGVAGAPANPTIVNTVVGKPYAPAAPVANVTAELLGGFDVASTLPAPGIGPGGTDSTGGGGAGGPAIAAANAVTFRQWNHFDRIRSTSDHLALAIEV